MKLPAFILALVSLLAPMVQSQEKAAVAPPVKLPAQAPNVAAQKFTPDGKVNPGFASSHEKFVKIAQEGNAELVFLGDSITAGWGKNAEIWDKSFGRYKPENFGIGGDRTQHVLWRITNGELDGLKAKAIVVMIGTNNSSTDPADGIAEGVKVIVETIRQKQPQSKIVLLAVFPRGEKLTANPGRDKLNEVNSIISKLHDGKNIHFLDIGSKFLQADGSLTKEIMPDFLHLSPAGYQIWADAIGPKLAELLDVNKQAAIELDWHDATASGVEGRILPDQPRSRWFDRLPSSAESTVTSNVWNLSRDSAGMVFRFKTDATAIQVHYKVSKSNLGMPHMPATGVSGVDLYARDDAGKWKWVQVTKPATQEIKAEIISGLAEGYREYAAYLPLYNGVEFLSIGVKKGCKFEGLSPREKPIVFYGTSITHGACASRPGMVHTGILGRKLDMPVVNLGFSGNGRMDKAVGDFLTQIDAAAYVIDCLPNMVPADVTAKCIPLVRQIRAVKPNTPIILVEDRRFTNDWILPDKKKFHTNNHAALRAAYEQLLKDGVSNLHYIPGDSLYGDDTEGATDASHANDLGFMRQAEVFEPILRKALASHALASHGGVTEAADGKVTLVAEGFQFTEGPAVDAQGNVYFTDQPNDRIMKVDTDGAVSEFLKPAGRSNGMFFAPDGKLISCADEKNEMWEIAADKTHKVLFSTFEEKKLNGPNDVWIDSNSTMYFTDPYYQRKWWEHKTRPQTKQSVYRVDRDGSNVTLVDDTLVQPNGIVGDSMRRLLFVADIGDSKTYQYTISNDGTLVDRKLFCKSGSDGMTIDAVGHLYLTGKKGVTVFDKEGKEVQVIAVPKNWTANVCIGGKDHKTLFITSSDSLYSVRVKHAGLSR